MICHLCRGEAVGQCKDCGRFYCPNHGDVYCVDCRDVTPGKKSSGDLDGPPRPPKRIAGIGCSLCQGPRRRPAAQCGAFYCKEHGGLDWISGFSKCGKCQQFANSTRLFLLMGFLPFFLILCICVQTYFS